jgi:hypothetical protein
MEKIFKTDKGKITLTENNGVIKINNSNGDYIKFTGAEAPFTAFVDDIETHIRAEKEDFGESFDWSIFGTLLNFYLKIADQFEKIEINSENPLVFSMPDWDKAKEISISIMERNVVKKGDTITYSLADKISITFDLKGEVKNLDDKGNIPEEETKEFVEMVKASIFQA